MKKLRIQFPFNKTPLTDWFHVVDGNGFCCIYSGLRHADGETISPFHYGETTTGKTAKKDAIVRFNNFYQTIKHLI